MVIDQSMLIISSHSCVRIDINLSSSSEEKERSFMTATLIIDPEILRDAILDKFGIQVEFAKEMGLTDSKVSRGMKKQSAKFMAIVRKAERNDKILRNPFQFDPMT